MFLGKSKSFREKTRVLRGARDSKLASSAMSEGRDQTKVRPVRADDEAWIVAGALLFGPTTRTDDKT